jgi:hypothetical protein
MENLEKKIKSDNPYKTNKKEIKLILVLLEKIFHRNKFNEKIVESK